MSSPAVRTAGLLAGTVGLLLACGAPAKKAPPSPQPTAVGSANGTLAMLDIGPDGGTVASADGKLTVRIPAGAVSATTKITVQPVTAKAAGGVRAWRLGPEGQTFQAPVELVFAYGPEDLEGTAPEALGIAFQKSDGVWAVLKQFTLDPAGKTLTAKTTHFSDWSMLQGLLIFPQDAVVLVGETLTLTVNLCSTVDQGDELTTLLARCEAEDVTLRTANWAVNGAPGGTDGTGLITGRETGSATYQAPARKPAEPRVAVSTEYTAQRTPGPRGLLVSHVNIVDAKGWAGSLSYTVTGSKTATESGMTSSSSWTKTTVSTVSGKGMVNLEPGGFPGTLTVSSGSGMWSESKVETTNTSNPQSLCPTTSVNTVDTSLSGTATNPTGNLATLAVTGSTYELNFSALGGMLAGMSRTTLTGMVMPAMGQSCSPFTPVNVSSPSNGSIPTDSLVVTGSIDGATPNLIAGTKTLTFGTDPVRSYAVTWQLRQ